MSAPKKDTPNPDELRKLFPIAEAFFTSIGLYQTFYLGNSFADERKMREVVDFAGTINFYCSKCQRDVDFLSSAGEKNRFAAPDLDAVPKSLTELEVRAGIHATTFRCSKHREHEIYFLFLVEKNYEAGEFRLTKIGQFPSIADLTADVLKKYRKTLSPQDYGDFNRAVGLAGHGIGIGAFVYLRRIFERLVEEAHQIAAKDADWSESDYFKSRMEEKIKLLKAHLPPFLSTNWQIYSILSKGLHELSEADCKSHFDIVKGGIELILDQKIEAQERQQREATLQAAIQKAAGALK
jgi:hypothetical protein